MGFVILQCWESFEEVWLIKRGQNNTNSKLKWKFDVRSFNIVFDTIELSTQTHTNCIKNVCALALMVLNFWIGTCKYSTTCSRKFRS